MRIYEWLRIRQYTLLLAAGFLFMLVFSARSLTTAPRLWIDEAKNIELAQSFNTAGRFDMEIAPGRFTGTPFTIQSTGYPVTAPLALFFKLFGFGLVQARVYMLLWMFSAVTALYLFLKSLCGERSAILSVLLVVTFASFYDNGRAMMGEIPGFFFLVSGFYFWFRRESLWFAGLLWGLAVVAKPSVYLLLIPALVIVLLFRSGRVKNIFTVGVSMLPAALGWALLVLDKPFATETWASILNLYGNPYNQVSIYGNVIKNLSGIIPTPTLIYFGLLFLLLLAARFWVTERKTAIFYDFTFVYSIFAFAYYLRSPGWLRYIIVAELLILSLAPHALDALFQKYGHTLVFLKRLGGGGFVVSASACLIAIQTFHLFTGAKIFFSDGDIKAAAYINETFAGKSVAFFETLNVAIFKERTERYMTISDAVIPVLSNNNTFQNLDPLALPTLPDAVVSKVGRVFPPRDAAVLSARYRLQKSINSYDVYELLKISPRKVSSQ